MQKTQHQQALTEARGALQQVQDQSHQLQIKHQSLESEQRARQSNIERIERQNEQFGERIAALQAAVDGADDPIETLQSELQALLESRNETEKMLSQSQQAVGEKDNRQRELEEERAQRQQQADEFRGQMEDQRMQLQEAKKRIRRITSRIRILRVRKGALEQVGMRGAI